MKRIIFSLLFALAVAGATAGCSHSADSTMSTQDQQAFSKRVPPPPSFSNGPPPAPTNQPAAGQAAASH